MSGNAVLKAVDDLKEKAVQQASRLLGIGRESLDVHQGGIVRKTDTSVLMSLQELARLSETQIKGYGSFDLEPALFDHTTGQGTPYQTYAFATHLADVEVDLETGGVKVHRLVAAHDSGRVVDWKNIAGQIAGGAVMALGYVLMEEFKPSKTVSFQHYLIPTSKDVPEIIPILVEDKEPAGPFGSKGIGELPVIAATPAIANAIADAIGERIYELPATLERVLEAARSNRSPSRDAASPMYK